MEAEQKREADEKLQKEKAVVFKEWSSAGLGHEDRSAGKVPKSILTCFPFPNMNELKNVPFSTHQQKQMSQRAFDRRSTFRLEARSLCRICQRESQELSDDDD
jgi:hypothetical protein